MKRPAFQFYPGDWLRDTALRACSIAARGLWVDLLSLMHDGTPYGHLAVNGRGLTDAQAAGAVGLSLREFRKLLGELESLGVPSRTAAGVVYSRRMVRDEEIRNKRAAGGSLSIGHPNTPAPRGRGEGGGEGYPSPDPSRRPSDPPPAVASAVASASARSIPTNSSDPTTPPPPAGGAAAPGGLAEALRDVVQRVAPCSIRRAQSLATELHPVCGDLLIPAAEAWARHCLALSPEDLRRLGEPVKSFRDRAGYWGERVRPGSGAEEVDPEGARLAREEQARSRNGSGRGQSRFRDLVSAIPEVQATTRIFPEAK